MGGAWYEKYIGNKDENSIYNLAFNEIKKHLNLKTDPDHYHLSILKVFLVFINENKNNVYFKFIVHFQNAIPQYKVGHQKLLKNIKESLIEEKLDNRFYLTGFSYEGVGVNDCLFNTRKLVQNVISKNKQFL